MKGELAESVEPGRLSKPKEKLAQFRHYYETPATEWYTRNIIISLITTEDNVSKFRMQFGSLIRVPTPEINL
jgi:hypothetical protein